jgi:hypothetical protein
MRIHTPFALPLLLMVGTNCTQRQSDQDAPLTPRDLPFVWSAEFSAPERSTTPTGSYVVYATLVLDSVNSTNDNHNLVGSYHLDSASKNIRSSLPTALLGDSESCLDVRGRLSASSGSNGMMSFYFTHAFDCDFLAEVHSANLSGSWTYLLMGGKVAQGNVRLSRHPH